MSLGEGRHPSVEGIARWFTFEHLPDHLWDVSQACHRLAADMLYALPDSPELKVGLRKLLEAKDAFVRCAVVAHETEHSLATTTRDSTTS